MLLVVCQLSRDIRDIMRFDPSIVTVKESFVSQIDGCPDIPS